MNMSVYRKLRQEIVPTLRFNQSLYEDVLLQTIPKGSIWLDAGCGWKILSEWAFESELSLINRASSIIGCDIDATAIAKHRSIQRRVVSDLVNLPFKEGSLDVITLNMVMEHVDHPCKMLAEFSRILRPDGWLIIHTPFRWSYFARLAALAPDSWKRKVRPDGREAEDYYPVRYRCNTPWTMRRFCSSAGLEEVRTLMFASDAICKILAGSTAGRFLLRLELYLIRLSLYRRFRYLRVTMCALYRKRC